MLSLIRHFFYKSNRNTGLDVSFFSDCLVKVEESYSFSDLWPSEVVLTSWSSWRSFTVTLLWSCVPLGNTPKRVITTGWSTLKSRAMADTSEGASSAGSDTVTISISASRPATGTEGLLHIYQSLNALTSCFQAEESSTISTLRSCCFFSRRLQSQPLSSVCFLNYKREFITQGINERSRPLKGRGAFTLYAFDTTSAALSKIKTIRGEDQRRRKKETLFSSSSNVFTSSEWNRAAGLQLWYQVSVSPWTSSR